MKKATESKKAKLNAVIRELEQKFELPVNTKVRPRSCTNSRTYCIP